jgi:hypothetical protein
MGGVDLLLQSLQVGEDLMRPVLSLVDVTDIMNGEDFPGRCPERKVRGVLMGGMPD